MLALSLQLFWIVFPLVMISSMTHLVAIALAASIGFLVALVLAAMIELITIVITDIIFIVRDPVDER